MINVAMVQGLIILAKMDYQGLDSPTSLKQSSHSSSQKQSHTINIGHNSFQEVKD